MSFLACPHRLRIWPRNIRTFPGVSILFPVHINSGCSIFHSRTYPDYSVFFPIRFILHHFQMFPSSSRVGSYSIISGCYHLPHSDFSGCSRRVPESLHFPSLPAFCASPVLVGRKKFDPVRLSVETATQSMCCWEQLPAHSFSFQFRYVAFHLPAIVSPSK